MRGAPSTPSPRTLPSLPTRRAPPWAVRTRAHVHRRCLLLLAPHEPLLRTHALAALGTPSRACRDTRSPASPAPPMRVTPGAPPSCAASPLVPPHYRAQHPTSPFELRNPTLS